VEEESIPLLCPTRSAQRGDFDEEEKAGQHKEMDE
jgi:hypothetical protein